MRRPELVNINERDYLCGLLTLCGPMTDEELWDRGARRRAGLSYDAMQKRRLELFKAGRIVDSGERRYSRKRNKSVVWGLASEPGN